MKKLTAISIILALILLTAIVAKINPQMHKTFEIQRIIIKKGVTN